MSPSDFDRGELEVVCRGFGVLIRLNALCSFVRLAGSRSKRSLFNPENVYTFLSPFSPRFGAHFVPFPCAKRATDHDPFPLFLRVIHGSNVCRVRLDSRVIILRPTVPFLVTGPI